ncbi:MAG: GNAT family N-acetyltransferase [Gammaproteobacteria bacterium]|nr:GNAT family N-acetyltransferase [Gammaproteobacteria bacterium]
MKFCLLTLEDTEALLAFELENRDWFEATIEKRADDFYDINSVKAQINHFLDLFQQKQMYPALIKDKSGKILARTNLRLANNGYDTIGYRVSKKASGKGVATFATKEILRIAKNEFNLNGISAFVSIENPASASVLSKFGFKATKLHPEMALVQGRKIDCHLYQLIL